MMDQLAYTQLPEPDEMVLPGVAWGRCDQLFTPAYWKVQYLMHETEFSATAYNYRYGNTLIHEICACLLGGYGIKAEVATEMFSLLREYQLLEPGASYESLLEVLGSSFHVNGCLTKYRFPNQKAKYLARFLNRCDVTNDYFSQDIDLRNWLLSIDGIGLKTASWITRNWMNSQNVAILDIHIHRAGLIAGFFDFDHRIEKDYLTMERLYLDFCAALKAKAADMDALIWLQLKQANTIAIEIVKNKMSIWEEEDTKLKLVG